MQRYLASLPLRPYIAELPEEVQLSGSEVSGVLGNRKVSISRLRDPIHVQFANWRSEPKDIVNFTKRFGVLWKDCFLEKGEAPSDYSSGEVWTSDEFVFEVESWIRDRDFIRDCWRHQLGTVPPPELKKGSATEYLWNERKKRGQLVEEDFVQLLKRRLDVCLDISKEKSKVTVAISLPDLWSLIVISVLQESPKSLRICKNEKCVTPYFVARRRDQKYCGSDCSQAVATRNWWNKHGNQWRKSKKNQ